MDYKASDKRIQTEKLYSRNGLLSVMRQENPEISEESVTYHFRQKLSEGNIIRVGWNQYVRSQAKPLYRYNYSPAALQTADFIQSNYFDADFCVFELIQLNDFMNHQLAHNVIFLSVEYSLVDFVFDSLRRTCPGKVLLKPRLEDYYRYITDDAIIVGRLPSESPKGHAVSWHSRLEKILVDIAVDKLLSKIVPPNEYPNIFQTAYEQYLFDEKAMIRYAKRRGAAEKLNRVLNRYWPGRQEEDR